jgi:uncharacterized protein YbjT (DUF2867 family)
MRPILVAGATGLLGSEICRLLCGSQHSVRGIVRPGSPREDSLHGYGVETIPGDLRDVRSLEAACRGVSTVISAVSGASRRLPGDSVKSVDREGQRALVDAARRGGVRRFILVSASPNLTRDIPLVRYKREIEASVRGSGMSWVIAQPSVFMESWFTRRRGFDVNAAKAVLLGAGDAPVSYVSVRDVAKAVAGAVDAEEDAARMYLPLGGPDALTPLDTVRIFEEESGRHFTVLQAPAPLAKGLSVLLRPLDAGLSSKLGMAAHLAHHGDVVESPKPAWEWIQRPVMLRDFARTAVRAALTERVRLLLRGAGGTRF